MQYIAIKNWERFQADKSGKVSKEPADWIKDYTDKVADLEYSQLSFVERYVYDELRRLRGRLGYNPPADFPYLSRTISALSPDKPRIRPAVSRLVSHGLVSFVDSKDSKFSPVSKSRVDKSRVDIYACNKCGTTEQPLIERPVSYQTEPKRYCESCLAEAEK
jgi:hypothetical protein